MRLDGVIPFTMKVITHDVEGLEFSVGDGETRWIGLGVLDRRDMQSFLGGRVRDQLNDRFQRGERFGSPMDGNKGKEAVFDCVPFARRRRIMRHSDGELFFIGQGQQGFFPQLVAYAKTFAPISRDEQFASLRIEVFATLLPLPANTFHCKLRCLMIDTHIHKPLVMHQIVDAIRDGFAISERAVIVDIHPRLLSVRLPFVSLVLERSQ